LTERTEHATGPDGRIPIGQAGCWVEVTEGAGPERVRILAFHGGGGVDGDPAMLAPFARRLAGPGVRVLAASYRTLNRDGASLEQMREDAATALAWACAGLEPEARLFVLGASFGGFLALDAVLNAEPWVAFRPAGLILLNPVVRTGTEGFCNRVLTAAHGDLCPLERLAGSPLPGRIRLFLAHGEADDVVPLADSRRLTRHWAEGRCALHPVADAGHGFFNRAPHDSTMADAIADFVAGPAPASRGLLPGDTRIVYGIGAQKAGTSWLYDYLSSHPEVCVPELKELHYFDVLHAPSERGHLRTRIRWLREAADSAPEEPGGELLKSLQKIGLRQRQLMIHARRPGDHGGYIDYMTAARQGQPVLCDVTPSYAVLDPEAFREMDAIGDARFIFMLRDPVDRLWSQIRMIVRSGQPGLGDADYETACADHARKMAEEGRLGTVHRVDYRRTVQALEAAIPAERILYAFHRPRMIQSTADDICDFLGIARRPLPETPGKRGRTAALPEDVETMMIDALKPQYDFAMERFGSAVPRDWHKRLARGVQRRLPLLRKVSEGPNIAFLHIPKTAGQTITAEVRRVVGERAFSPVRTHAQAEPDAQMPPGYRFYAGHIDWVDLETIPDPRFAFTVLRDPKERIASFYFYLQREAKKLSQAELATGERTNMRMVLTNSIDDYFFGGPKGWQRFIQDHYDNFYCTYLITRRIRGSEQVRDMDAATMATAAIEAAQALDGIYSVDDLSPLEADLGKVLGTPVKLVGNYRNAGPEAKQAKRWDALVALFENPENVRRLERFVEADIVLMQRLGLPT
jgi:acetyl esterase/lipase